MNLWRHNPFTGYWDHVRSCAPETAESWLEIFQRDEPGRRFKLAKYKPKPSA